MAADIAVEVVLAFADRQYLRPLQLPPGSTALDAIHASKLLELPGLDADLHQLRYGVGVFGELLSKPASYQLQPGDRVEIYHGWARSPSQY